MHIKNKSQSGPVPRGFPTFKDGYHEMLKCDLEFWQQIADNHGLGKFLFNLDSMKIGVIFEQR